MRNKTLKVMKRKKKWCHFLLMIWMVRFRQFSEYSQTSGVTYAGLSAPILVIMKLGLAVVPYHVLTPSLWYGNPPWETDPKKDNDSVGYLLQLSLLFRTQPGTTGTK
jgi:hypothetical protein